MVDPYNQGDVPPEQRVLEAMVWDKAVLVLISAAAEAVAVRHPSVTENEVVDLIARLWLMPDYYRSKPGLEATSWSVPKDLPPWKRTRKSLKKLGKTLRSAEDQLREALQNDPTFIHALNLADSSGGLGERYASLIWLRGMCESAAAVRGPAGNRPLPAWMERAAVHCQRFWRVHVRAEPKPYFSTGDGLTATRPMNEFTAWFCDVMQTVDEKITVSECETALRNLSARK